MNSSRSFAFATILFLLASLPGTARTLKTPSRHGPLIRRPDSPQPSEPPAVTIDLGKEAKLPFALSDEKKLDPQDLQDKKTGFFVTGLPQITSDPVEGTGFGLNAYFNFNGEKTDPFFAYTPYRSRLGLDASVTSRGSKDVSLEFDAPYIADSKWRLRANMGYVDTPNQLYFGSTGATMGPLVHEGKVYDHYSDYENALEELRPGRNGEASRVTDRDYNRYRLQEWEIGSSLEYSLAEGKVRAIGGASVNASKLSTFDGEMTDLGAPNGTSLLSQDSARGVRGLGNNLITTVRAGIVYDTRDLEPDPGRGIFAELTNELSLRVLGSSSNFDKIYFQVKHFAPLLPPAEADLVLASRLAANFTVGDAPFYELGDGWSSEGDIEGLGGLRTLRGFKDSRFLAPVNVYANLELRYGFANFGLWGQRLTLKAVPFFDVGRVWDRIQDVDLTSYRADGGVGLRVVWNQSTVLMMDYAVSGEDRQFFLNFDHIF